MSSGLYPCRVNLYLRRALTDSQPNSHGYLEQAVSKHQLRLLLVHCLNQHCYLDCFNWLYVVEWFNWLVEVVSLGKPQQWHDLYQSHQQYQQDYL